MNLPFKLDFTLMEHIELIFTKRSSASNNLLNRYNIVGNINDFNQ